jgi:hypothetical protein
MCAWRCNPISPASARCPFRGAGDAELTFADETATRRFDVDTAEDAETLIQAFEDSSSASFDVESGEICFTFDYAAAETAEHDDEDGDEDEDEVAEDGSEDEDGPGEDDDGDDARRKVA